LAIEAEASLTMKTGCQLKDAASLITLDAVDQREKPAPVEKVPWPPHLRFG
jgi:hypothetical protein